MSDARQRRDERDDDDADAEVRVLARRLRSGELSPERLELAAWVGHTPSARVLDVPERPPLPLTEVVVGLERWGHGAVVRGLLAIGRTAAPRMPAAQRELAVALCEHVDEWLEGGDDAEREAILEAAERLRRVDAGPRGLDAVVRMATALTQDGAPGEVGPGEVRARVWQVMEGLAPASPQDAAVMAVGLTAWITAQAVPLPDRQQSLRRFVGWIRRAGVTDQDMREALLDLAAWALAGER